MACTPDNCDISSGEYLHKREIASADRTVEALRMALQPLANMHIPGAPPDYVLCQRAESYGRGARYMLTMAHAARAFHLLDDHTS